MPGGASGEEKTTEQLLRSNATTQTGQTLITPQNSAVAAEGNLYYLP